MGKKRLKLTSPRASPMVITALRGRDAGRRGGSAGDLIVLIQEKPRSFHGMEIIFIITSP